ncbi:MAG: DUF262 domain-containing protein [Synergistaceae bacterium]|nr:DUF262 domain-containing protein [Synergistaceae bacterium]MBR1604167.1 DUF262 domain-containing protein [Synergistaceae bacterium]
MSDVKSIKVISNVNAAIDTNQSIAEVLKNINLDEKGGIFLPYIQRDFVWDEEQICLLLDSLMRGYPTGTILIWETDESINYRRFAEDYSPKSIAYDFLISGDGITRAYILDGQQRLQSLYIAMHGTYGGKALYFNLLSDEESGYEFKFIAQAAAKDNWLNVPEFLASSKQPDFNTIDEFIKHKIISPLLSNEIKSLILNNANRLYRAFKTDHNIPLQKLAGLPSDDIAKIFIRTNSGGVVLDATDLIMATISSEWIGAKQEFDELINMINKMGFKKPKEFIFKACFATLTQTAGNAKNLSDKQNELRDNFPKLGEAINDVLNFVRDTAESSGMNTFNIPFYNPILILVAYRYYHDQTDWSSKLDDAKAFLLTAFLCRDFTRPTQKLMKELLEYAAKRTNKFSLSKIKEIFNNNNKNFAVNAEALLETRINSPLSNLIMYLVYNGQKNFDMNTMTAHDHIFPKSKLAAHRENGHRKYSQKEYDSILNCELLTSAENQVKGDELPTDYFTRLKFAGSAQLKNFLELHAIPDQFGKVGEDKIDLWDIENYREFLDERKKLMIKRIERNLAGLVSSEANVSSIIKNLLKKVLASK